MFRPCRKRGAIRIVGIDTTASAWQPPLVHRIRVFLGREGIEFGKEKCSRLWSEHGLQVSRKRARRRVAARRPRPLAPAKANAVWSYDFVFDACANGQQIKCLTVVDEYT